MQLNTEPGLFAYSDRGQTELDDLAEKIKLCAKDVIESSQDAIKSAIAAGGHLIKAKKRVVHGKWGPWLKENFEFSQGTASNWMRMWEHKEDIMDLTRDDKNGMTVNKALQLIAEPAKQLTKLQRFEKKCINLQQTMWDLPKGTESRKARPILKYHIDEVRKFTRERTR